MTSSTSLLIVGYITIHNDSNDPPPLPRNTQWINLAALSGIRSYHFTNWQNSTMVRRTGQESKIIFFFIRARNRWWINKQWRIFFFSPTKSEHFLGGFFGHLKHYSCWFQGFILAKMFKKGPSTLSVLFQRIWRLWSAHLSFVFSAPLPSSSVHIYLHCLHWLVQSSLPNA